ncbi:ATP-dependent DNA helicase RecG [Candidatus Nitrospira neomarina]|uniref:Probable DNA 3'-5' helicase RecG n=1 Tax=Candidatus Nitrospira neomarina TaxID=3020899 RepID=A0AA96GI93_9BACT|nr:ATP-dependent DNA helicase RecG [Candidatus Nitrospira neomarina]WNM61822.1 ATP-dependent DNA helicase RecG [Candidatus Nitrospira neomarina]
MPTPSSLSEIPIQFAKGVGPRRARLLEKLDVKTLEDAFWFLPWRYENRLEVLPIGNLLPGMKATIKGRVQKAWVKTTYRRRLVVVTVTVRDETGLIECVFFNQPYLEKTFVPGVSLLLTGPVLSNSSGSSPMTMRGPEYELLDEDELPDMCGGRIVPVYHETNGLSSKQIRRIIRSIFDHYADQLQEMLPLTMRTQLGVPALPEALPVLHFPNQERSVEALNAYATPEHQRLAFEELFLLQLALAMRRQGQTQDTQDIEGIPFVVRNPLVEQLKTVLPFSLTSAQERVIKEISHDMGRPISMNRLLQGDVGCGKTVVALHAIVMACGSGYQAALMAPTEVLSEQHYLSLLPLFDALGVRCLLLKGGQTGRERGKILAGMQSGQVQVVVGTHALLQPDVHFAKLGLVIVDEQHKFGVLQRAQLRGKAPWHPDVLVMTATPIPRTLAMTMYGDLDVSIIDQFPPGKKPVKTMLFPTGQRKDAHRLMRKELEAGRQAYVVYPLVEPSEKIDLQAAIEAAEQLREECAPFRIGLLHGRLPSREKQVVMAQFKKKEIDVLVATTVVEVGLDVHNATVMLIEHAERFGLAQLHQLRGRVGRGRDQGYCVLIHGLGKIPPYSQQIPLKLESSRMLLDEIGRRSPGEAFSPSTARRRLGVFAQCEDGFALAEEDLKIRGPGHVLGVKQWGEMDFRVADLARDTGLLIKAKQMAGKILEGDPRLTLPDHRILKEALFRKWGEKFALGSIG